MRVHSCTCKRTSTRLQRAHRLEHLQQDPRLALERGPRAQQRARLRHQLLSVAIAIAIARATARGYASARGRLRAAVPTCAAIRARSSLAFVLTFSQMRGESYLRARGCGA